MFKLATLTTLALAGLAALVASTPVPSSIPTLTDPVESVAAGSHPFLPVPKPTAVVPELLAPLNGNAPREAQQCNTGTIQCCNHMVSQNSPKWQSHLNKAVAARTLSADAGSFQGDLGFECNTINVFAGSLTDQCNAKPVCCKGTASDGVLNFGCVPFVA
ncbi:hypothetical protein L226DRAFT_574132 [Lentinus tigrinus ALCF2SS1-7]|uniref:Hydrophobin n=1 Tax=Lentinus tigrinus ALCF2SS1-6 TaxID=1328759 RepID=A0A5C2S0C7_9APHY|nr:hypothetical protein L227DRAFT_614154 [Lentinus tigrinus ALCF2SS1-6]RPD71121.1 hypothetical protein L226DRAFT_574132 [Lentinus tigrinus ALCF2SS1-7]